MPAPTAAQLATVRRIRAPGGGGSSLVIARSRSSRDIRTMVSARSSHDWIASESLSEGVLGGFSDGLGLAPEVFPVSEALVLRADDPDPSCDILIFHPEDRRAPWGEHFAPVVAVDRVVHSASLMSVAR